MPVFKASLLTTLVSGICLASSVIHAGPMSAKLSRLLNEHNLMLSAQESLNAAKSRVDVEEGIYFPTVAVGGSVGYEDYNRSNGADTSLNTTTMGASLTQRVWDFGASQAAINKAQMVERLAQIEVDQQAQKLVLAALEAEQKLRNALVVLEYAEESEQNIKNQTRLETTRIESGRGYETDLLQAKSQLAAAEARKVAAIGEMEKARNRYQAVYGYDAPYPTTTDNLSVPEHHLPRTLQQAIDAAIDGHVDLLVSRAEVDVARAETRRLSKSETSPLLDFVASYDDQHNTDGVDADHDSLNLQLQLNWDFDLGGQADNRIRAATHNSASAEHDYFSKERQVIEDIRDVWIELKTAESKLAHLENQARISEQFLTLAREERELGKRSLLDVLSGETSLMNAKSEAGAARSDMIIAQLNLLAHVGRLDIYAF